jgi:fibronectin type 3 domain-containing protein
MTRSIGHWKTMVMALAIVAGWAAMALADGKTLAIFNLRPTNIDAMGYSGDILFSVVSAIEKEKRIQLMPRRQIEEVLFQEGMVQSDKPDQVIKAGAALGINFILFGQVTKSGASINTDLHLMDIQQQTVTRSWSESFVGREAITAWVPGFADELAGAVERSSVVAAAPPVTEFEGLLPEVLVSAVKARGEGNHIVVSWSLAHSASAEGYHVYRASSLTGPYQFLGMTTDQRFLDDKVRKGMTYYYRIGVLQGAGKERQSDMTAKIAFTGERMPHPPLIMSGTGHVRRATIQLVPSLLNDQEGFAITGYIVYRRGKGDADWVKILDVDAKGKSQSELSLTVEDTGQLTDGQVYQYAVSSIDKKGLESDLSDPAAITIMAKPVLELEKDGLLRQVFLRWQPVKNASGYRIYRSTDGLSWERIGSNSGDGKVSYVDKKNLADGVDYHYQVTAYDKKGESSPSNVILAKTKDLPEPPQGVNAKSNMVKSVAISWEPIMDPDVGGYNIYRGTSPQRLERITSLRGNDESAYTDKGGTFSSLADGTDYYYSVETFNTYKAPGGVSPPVMATTKPRPVPVKGLDVKAGSDDILITWQPNPEKDIKAYLVYRMKGEGSWSKIETVPGSQTRLSDADLKPEIRYRYRIVAVDADGLESDPVDSGSVDSPLIPSS